MSDHFRSGNDLVLPFGFVARGDDPNPPELVEFKARYPGWFTIPATFTPHDVADKPNEAPRRKGSLD